MNKPSEIILIGAGLVGSLLSIYLARRGYQVTIFERRQDMRRHKISAGRSINLSLSVRGIHALKEVELFDKVKPLLVPMRSRMIHDLEGNLQEQPYGHTEREVHYSVSRAALNVLLMDAAEATTKVKIQFEQKCEQIDFATRQLTLCDETTKTSTTLSFQTIIATDGSNSAIRQEMQQQLQHFQCSEDYIEHGYKELTIPARPDGSYAIEKNALHIWPRGEYMLIALPNVDGSFTVTLFLPLAGERSFAKLTDGTALHTFFAEQFGDALEWIPNLEQDFFNNPTGRMITVRCQPWHINDAALLLGDAAHAIVPFHGQGMNCGFEDCSTLNELLEHHAGNWPTLFAELEKARKPNCDAIADLSLENYIEMRSKVRDPHFLAKKQLGLHLEEAFPDLFIPRYSMVMFHRIPYAVAKERGKIQAEILDSLCKSDNPQQPLDLQAAKKLLQQRLPSIS